MRSIVGQIHDCLVFRRRTRILAAHLGQMIPLGSRVLDVGCGDGTIDAEILSQRSDLSIQGIDPLVRPKVHIPVLAFDGQIIPFLNDSFDLVMLVDVLHHVLDPHVLLKEAARVAKVVLIKDHFREGLLAGVTLRMMDWAGNAHQGVMLPYNYWAKSEWIAAFQSVGLRVDLMRLKLSLYPFPITCFFDRGLHFIARCNVTSS